MLQAVEQIRRMRGGAQAHLMRCVDGNYYVVKFQNNPQHRRILVNELLGTRLAGRLGLPTAPVSVVDVPEELVRLTPELCVETPRMRIPCQAGLQFGSRYPGDPRRMTLHDFLPDEKLREVDNLHEFAGMLVFDKWTCNTNGRQTVFFETERRRSGTTPGSAPVGGTETASVVYHTVMIDQGFCFNAGEWNFPDAPLRGLYARNRVYEGVIGMESFAPWLERLEKQVSERVLAELAEEIPPAWYEDDYDALVGLLEQLFRRRARVAELLLSARNSNRQPFPYWRGSQQPVVGSR
jgi:HipA-like protein